MKMKSDPDRYLDPSHPLLECTKFVRKTQLPIKHIRQVVVWVIDIPIRSMINSAESTYLEGIFCGSFPLSHNPLLFIALQHIVWSQLFFLGAGKNTWPVLGHVMSMVISKYNAMAWVGFSAMGVYGKKAMHTRGTPLL